MPFDKYLMENATCSLPTFYTSFLYMYMRVPSLIQYMYWKCSYIMYSMYLYTHIRVNPHPSVHFTLKIAIKCVCSMFIKKYVATYSIKVWCTLLYLFFCPPSISTSYLSLIHCNNPRERKEERNIIRKGRSNINNWVREKRTQLKI